MNGQEHAPLRRRLTRLARLAVLVGVGVLVVRMFQNMPSDVHVSFFFGEARQGLSRMDASYRLGGQEVRSVTFHYDRTPAPRAQVHRARLLDGEHTVVVRLTYPRDRVPAALRGQGERRAVGRATEVLLRRPLPVSGEGSVVLYVGPDPADPAQ